MSFDPLDVNLLPYDTHQAVIAGSFHRNIGGVNRAKDPPHATQHPFPVVHDPCPGPGGDGSPDYELSIISYLLDSTKDLHFITDAQLASTDGLKYILEPVYICFVKI